MLNISELIRDVVVYEQFENEKENWDIDATVLKMIPHVESRLSSYPIQEMPNWRFQELVHLVALDWFSSYEPIAQENI